ncbi:MAG: SIS domain-containing protein [Bacillota bacterium]|jgi:uncharacterized phosphosugar-binding protein
MHSKYFLDYLRKVQNLIDEAKEQESSVISDAADLIVEAIARERVLYVFGPSHAGILAQDLFYRAGGLMAIQPIFAAGLMLNERPITRTSSLERLSGFAEVLIKDLNTQNGDVALLISVSGRNPVVVEMCTGLQEKGLKVIALTSLAYSKNVEPRSGSKRLFEVADIVINLPGQFGDAAIEIYGLKQRVGPTSTSVGSAILQGLMVEVSSRLSLNGIAPPVLFSANLDEGDEKNQELLDLYRSRLDYI